MQDSWGAGKTARQDDEFNALRMDAANQNMAYAQDDRARQGAADADAQTREGLQWLAGATGYALKNPQALPKLIETGKSRGFIQPDFDPSTIPPEELMQKIEGLHHGALVELGGQPEVQSDLPSRVQNAQWWEQATDEQRQAYLSANNAGTFRDVGGVPTWVPPGGGLPDAGGTGAAPVPLSTLDQEAAGQSRIAGDVAAAKTTADVTTKNAIEDERNRPQQAMAAQASINSIDSTLSQVDAAMGLANWWSTGTMAQIMSGLGATDARSLKAALQPIRSSLAFDRLQAMRDASKTGGALGAISEKELDLLEGAITSLDQAQSVPALVESLKRVRKHYEKIRRQQTGLAAIASGMQFISTPQEALSLPPGTSFVNPEGRVLRVPDAQ
jgi:hypothetical protein